MFIDKVPQFKQGNILKKDMLQRLRDYPRDFLSLYFQNYSSGIITGLDISEVDNKLKLSPGIIKFSNRIYLLEKEVEFNYSASESELLIKIEFLAPEETKDFTVYKSDISIVEADDLEENELELGRFNLRPKANLRTSYNDFSDFATEYNTVNIIDVKYSHIEQPTLHTSITRNFALELNEQSNLDPIDFTFTTNCLNSRAVAREVIVNYIENKLNVAAEEYTNQELYNYLRQIACGSSRSESEDQSNYSNKIVVN